MKLALGSIDFGNYLLAFTIQGEGENWITLYDKDLDEEWTMEYEDAQVIMPTVTLLMYSETMREEFKNA